VGRPRAPVPRPYPIIGTTEHSLGGMTGRFRKRLDRRALNKYGTLLGMLRQLVIMTVAGHLTAALVGTGFIAAGQPALGGIVLGERAPARS
jgi:hypothetical protein